MAGDSYPNSNADRPPNAAVTALLVRARQGDARATDELLPLVYDELRSIATQHLSRERSNHTLQPTALVHEAYMKLVGPGDVKWDSRAHFFGAAARAIRRILTDYARGHQSLKRGGGRERISLEQVDLESPGDGIDLVALDGALDRLAEIDLQKSKVVELRFFAGLTGEETALALGVSPSTVAREWAFARVWLRRELARGDGP
jgi:RNA polymerase sigma factor (TIGR02999 family)